MIALLPDHERVAHVPGVLLRRAEMFNRDMIVVELLKPHAPETRGRDISFLLHNYLVFCDETEAGIWKNCVREKMAHWQREDPTRLESCVDVFIAAAAVGNLELLDVFLRTSGLGAFRNVDIARMMEVACLNRRIEFATQLCEHPRCHERCRKGHQDLDWKEQAQACLKEGARRAIDALVKREDPCDIEWILSLEVLGLVREDMNLVANDKEASQDLEQPSMDDITPDNRLASSNATANDRETVLLKVLTDASLIAYVGSFQEEPMAFVERFVASITLLGYGPYHNKLVNDVGFLPRAAIVEGDLHTLKTIYQVSRRQFSPRYSFCHAMHFAACEGRLEMLQWLHTLPKTRHKCRPDTMAMAVRYGWADVVEWLHFNCSTSKLSMSEHAVNDAARWGHLDVLAVCHKYQLAEFTAATLEAAAHTGRLDVVKVVRSCDPALSTSAAMDSAIRHCHVEVVKWLHTNCGEPITVDRLATVLGTTHDNVAKMTSFVWSVVDPRCDEVRECAQKHFSVICSSGTVESVMHVLSFVVADQMTLRDGLRGAVTKARVDIVNLLLPHVTDDSAVSDAFKQSVTTRDVALVAALLKTHRIAAVDLAGGFTTAVRDNASNIVESMLDSCDLGEQYDDALVLAVQLNHAPVVKLLYPRRSEQGAIRSLQAVTTLTIAQLILNYEDLFFTERIMLENASSFVALQLIRYILRHGRPQNSDAVANFSCVGVQKAGRLTLAEVDSLQELGDKDVNALVTRRCEDVLAPSTILEALRDDNAAAIAYFHHTVSMPPSISQEVLALACTNGQVNVVDKLLAMGVCAVPRGVIMKTLDLNHINIVGLLASLPNDRIDQNIRSVLHDALLPSRESVRDPDGSTTPPTCRWTIPLVQKLLETNPRHRQELLEIAAQAGSLSAINLILEHPITADSGQIDTLPVMLIAARGGHKQVIETLYAHKRPDEAIDAAQLRQSCSLSDAAALQTLLSTLQPLDLSVRQQLEQEQHLAGALFGLSLNAKPSSSHKRNAVKSKRGTRRP